MFNPLNLFSKLIKSGNQNELNRIQKIIKEINLLEKDIEKLEDFEFPKKTSGLSICLWQMQFDHVPLQEDATTAIGTTAEVLGDKFQPFYTTGTDRSAS